jgi:NodT family efflux transporter outer membrane factor (OMF) lipoprotein
MDARSLNANKALARTASLCICALTVLAACATPKRTDIEANAPAAFEYAQEMAGKWPPQDWYGGFDSAELDELVALAKRNNLDLAAAAARIRQADARARAAGAAILPQIDAGGNLTHVTGRARGQTASETDWSALLSASYEIDFWGKNRDAAHSAQFAAAAGQADHDALVLTTLTSVANGYFLVLSLRERLALAEQNLRSVRDVLEVIEARFNAGAAAAADLAAQRAAVANAELALPALRQQEVEARGALALLVGRAPEGFEVRGQPLDSVLEPSVTPGLPSALLLRRPDVLAAEMNLRAANADLAAARAALFPSLTLTGSGGLQNPAVQAAVLTLEGTGYSLSLGASLVQTIFDGGRRRSVRDEAQAKEQELLAVYRLAILNALLDVENALFALQQLDAQQTAQTQNVAQSELAYEGARLRFRAGSEDYLRVLDAQRTLFAAREQLSQYRLARLQTVVGLCKALGGGWQPQPPSPSLPP